MMCALLAYPEELAGGLMTTEYRLVLPVITAAQALQILRETADKLRQYSIFMLSMNRSTWLVMSLKALLFAHPDTLVIDFMQSRVVSVIALDEQDKSPRWLPSMICWRYRWWTSKTL